MTGEKAQNSLPQPTTISMEGLNDWTITDIATAPKTAPEDRANAEAEIIRRQQNNEYNPDTASRDVRTDMLRNGYGMENGKILYPKEEFNEWPTAIKRETANERLKNLIDQHDALAEKKMEDKLGNIAMTAFDLDDRTPMREKIIHPTRFTPERTAHVAKQRGESELLSTKVEKIYDNYEARFSENSLKWMARGVSKAIQRGAFDNSTIESMMISGFWDREHAKIHDKICPNDDFSVEEIDAEAQLKIRVAHDLIGERAKELPEQEIKSAKYKGSLYAINTGATLDKYSQKVTYAIALEKGAEARKFMEDAGVDFSGSENEAKARTLSYQGFANIIEAIKNNPKETERGFQALDWYFDNFEYGKALNVANFLGNLGEYEEVADDAWKNKYNEYLDGRKEINEFYENQKKIEAIPVFEQENVQENVSPESLRKKLLEVAGREIEQILTIVSEAKEGVGRHGKSSHEIVDKNVEPQEKSYIDPKKLNMILDKFDEYKKFDENAKLHTVFWINNHNKETHYAVLEYTEKNTPVAVIAPYEARSADAAFDAIGVDWREAFIETPESKLSVRERTGVKAFNHRANMKVGRDAIQNMWHNHEKHVKKVLDNKEIAA